MEDSFKVFLKRFKSFGKSAEIIYCYNDQRELMELDVFSVASYILFFKQALSFSYLIENQPDKSFSSIVLLFINNTAAMRQSFKELECSA